jgi:hypothetical protein
MNEERVSIREYARRIGVSDTAVRKAIKSDKIIKGLVRDYNGNPLIIPDVATEEWRLSRDITHVKTVSAKLDTVPKPKPQKEKVQKSKPQKVNPQALAKIESETFQEDPISKMENSLVAAKRAQAVYKAKMMELEMKQKQGLLVDKKLVYSALFDAGKELRQAFEALPDRWIDQIISAAKDRNKAHLILTDAIQEVLGRLSDIEDRMNFEKR